MAFVDNKLYISLYESYKEIKEERIAKKWGEYEINVIQGVKGILENFQSVDENKISKNGKKNEYFSKIKQEDKKEKMGNYPKKFESLRSKNQDLNIDVDENA